MGRHQPHPCTRRRRTCEDAWTAGGAGPRLACRAGFHRIRRPPRATRASSTAIAELGASPPVLFPVMTSGAADIVATYQLLATGPHAELLIDRQGYVRAIWDDAGGAVQTEVEKLNAEKSPPPFPDDHVH